MEVNNQAPAEPEQFTDVDCSIHKHNLSKLKERPPLEFSFIRLDTNCNCNLNCLYCHNYKSDEFMDEEELRGYVNNNVISVHTFQFGCGWEPTMDQRLCDMMLMVANSPAKPKETFMLQTNGTLLHRHDYGKMREAGVNRLTVSIDSADPDTHWFLRGGTRLDKIVSNIQSIHKACPEIQLQFIPTVNSLNVRTMEDLVAFGLDLGVTSFVFREIFYVLSNKLVDHSIMPALLLRENDFATMKENLIKRFGDQTQLFFADEEYLINAFQKQKPDSAIASEGTENQATL